MGVEGGEQGREVVVLLKEGIQIKRGRGRGGRGGRGRGREEGRHEGEVVEALQEDSAHTEVIGRGKGMAFQHLRPPNRRIDCPQRGGEGAGGGGEGGEREGVGMAMTVGFEGRGEGERHLLLLLIEGALGVRRGVREKRGERGGGGGRDRLLGRRRDDCE